MINEDRDEQLERLLDARTSHGVSAEQPDVSQLGTEDLEAELYIADLLSEGAYVLPALEHDPTAVMLGLIPDPLLSLDHVALARIRKNSRLTVSELAKRLVARGWETTSAQLFRWETQGAFDVSPALIRAIAEALGTSADRITASSTGSTKPEWLLSSVGSSSFTRVVQRWAALRAIPVQLAREGLEARMLATVHRGGRPEPEQLLQALEAFVSAMEQANGKGM